MATIVLTGGGSAGHCTPHLALLPYLKKDFKNLYYIGSEKGIERSIIENTDIPYYSVPCTKLNRNFTLKNLTIPFKLLSGIRSAGKLLDFLKPDVIFSKGGYVSLPVVISAHKRGIPVIAHESDYSMGLANKISSRYCEKVLTSFPETAKEIKNGEFVGSPIRKIDVSEKNYSKFGFNQNKPVLLVIGGSLGATAINSVVREALPYLIKKYNVIHLCGKGNLDNGLEQKGYYQAEFLHRIDDAFAIADVCISRAGANSLFELLSLKIPSLLIPLPKGASRGDQILNASYFEKLGLVSVLQQENLSAESLIFNVNNLFYGKNNALDNFKKNPISDKSRTISKILAEHVKR